MHMHCICTFLRFTCIEVLCWHEVKMTSVVFLLRGVLFYSYVDIVYLLYIMPITCLFMEISMDKYSYHEPLFSMTCIFFKKKLMYNELVV